MIMVLAAGVCMAYGGAEVRARTAEVLYPLLFFPILLLMLLSAFHQQPGISEAGLVFGEYQEALGQLLKIFSVFGGLSFYVFLAPYVSGQEKGLARKGLWRAAAALAALFLLVAAAFGERGMALLPWPAVSFMSSARVPGGFLSRWDDFYGASGDDALVSAGSSLFYLGLIGKLLFPKWGKLRGGLAVLVFLVALWCGENGKAAKIYDLEQLCGGSGERGVSGDGTVYWEKNRKEGCGFVWKRTEKRTERIRGLNDRRHLGAAGFVACWILLTLSGCSAQELEARDFVSVLTVPDGDTESLLAERQRTSTCTLDYSHTKAVILDTTLTQNPSSWTTCWRRCSPARNLPGNLLVLRG